MPRAELGAWAALLGAAGLFSVLLFAGLGHPLLWNDEGDTAVFAERVLRHGYPKAHGQPPILYNLKPERIDPESDAYRGGLWGYYYLGAVGAALAAGVEDVHARTARLRLPFAVAGWLGVGIALAAIWPALAAGGRRQGLVLATVFLLLASASTSLLLHLREARWYGAAVLLVSASVALFLRRLRRAPPSRAIPGPRDVASALPLALLLFALFNVFHPGFFATVASLGLFLVARAVRGGADGGQRWHALARDALPLALAGVAALPVALHFDLFSVSLDWASDLSRSARGWGENLRFVLSGMLRYELLAPALVGRLAVLGSAPADEVDPRERRAREASALLAGLVVVWVLLLSRSPLVWERYFIVLSPVLIALVLLDAAVLWWRAGSAAGGTGLRAARLRMAILAASVLLALGVRGPELRGRMAEILVPVQGPLDVVVPWLLAERAPTEALVIATNYEGPSLSWYLGSHVVLGYYGGNLEADRELSPDVLFARPWPRRQQELLALYEGGDWEPVRFDVRNTRTNNMPSLWLGSPGRVRHRFATERATKPEEETVLWVRPTTRERTADEPSG